MPTSDAAAASNRPRPFLLVLLGLAALALVVYSMWSSSAASPNAPPSNQRRQQVNAGEQSGAGALDVRLESLKQPSPPPEEAGRNPFRFYVKPPPPPPPRPPIGVQQTPQPGQPGYRPPAPAGPPPIPLKFIGTAEQGTRKVAIFSDGRGQPVYAFEGQLVLGQYKLVKIGVESVVMEYPDGRGRQTIPMRGQ
jgi:hypothetical protein